MKTFEGQQTLVETHPAIIRLQHVSEEHAPYTTPPKTNQKVLLGSDPNENGRFQVFLEMDPTNSGKLEWGWIQGQQEFFQNSVHWI